VDTLCYAIIWATCSLKIYSTYIYLLGTVSVHNLLCAYMGNDRQLTYLFSDWSCTLIHLRIRYYAWTTMFYFIYGYRRLGYLPTPIWLTRKHIGVEAGKGRERDRYYIIIVKLSVCIQSKDELKGVVYVSGPGLDRHRQPIKVAAWHTYTPRPNPTATPHTHTASAGKPTRLVVSRAAFLISQSTRARIPGNKRSSWFPLQL